MAKRTIRSAIIFLGIVSIVPMCQLFYGFIAPYSWMVMPIGDGAASVTTWLDSNANGIKDAGEKNLPNVCVWSEFDLKTGAVFPVSCETSITDEHGRWDAFLPGGSCEKLFVFAKAPKGFHATTDLVSNGCDAKIGFVQENIVVTHKVLSIADYIQQQNMFSWLKRIAIGFIIVVVGILGTIWLEKPPKENGSA
jgi:hypothetical protein